MLSLRPILLAVLAIVLTLGVSLPADANSAERGQQKFDRFIVKYQAKSTAQRVSAARQRSLDAAGRVQGLAVSQLQRMGTGADVVRTNRKLDHRAAQAFMNQLRRDPAVEYVEIDKRMRATFTPNDVYYNGNQWHYYEATGGIGMPAAWDLATGSGVVVAVLDTGITAHTDLAANLVAGYDFIGDLFTANDGNGRDADPSDPGDWVAADECDPGEPADDSSWHGTHVAGTIAAVTNNGTGVAGIAYNAKVMPLRVLGRCGGFTSDIGNAIIWASGGAVPGVPANPNPVEVINMSLGGPGSCSASTQSAINAAVAAGVTVVVSAGNDNVDTAGYEPANCQNVIAVAANNRTGAKAGFSNYGATVDITAPGGGETSFIASTWNEGKTTPGVQGYVGMQGTSMAAPHVAGAIAVMQSFAPSAPAVVESIIKKTARAMPVACPQGCGSGILNVPAALIEAGNGVLTISDASLAEGNAGTTAFSFTVTLSKAMPTAVTFNIATANGTAAAGSDFAALSLSGQSIAAGATSKTFMVNVNGDTGVEADETFTVNVSGVSGISVGKAQGLGTIVNDDATPLVNGVPVGPIAVTKGGGVLYSLQVPAGRSQLVFATTGGSAGQDADLFVKFGSAPTIDDATFACVSEGSTSVESCPVANPVAGTYYLLMYAYTTFSGVTLTGTYTPGDLPTLSVGDVSLTEGNAGTKLAVFPITLSQSLASAVSFDVFTGTGTASAGSDYVTNAIAGQTIPAGQTSANFTVSINGDSVVEANETFTVNLANASGAGIGDGQGQGRIINDDVATLSIGDVTVAEGDSGTSTARFVIRLSEPLPNPVTFDVATSNGSATAGSDYVALSQSGRYLDAGRTTQVFEVAINGDTVAEATETFNVTVGNVNGATLADGSAIGTIGNDEAATITSASSTRSTTLIAPMVLDASWQDKDEPACGTAREKAQARRRGKWLAECAVGQRH
jgi:serine protease